MVIFHSYVKLPEGISGFVKVQTQVDTFYSSGVSCLSMSHFAPTSRRVRKRRENPWLAGRLKAIQNWRKNGGTWWLIPLSKWVITPVISGLSLLIPFITGVITHLLSGMSHQVPSGKLPPNYGKSTIFYRRIHYFYGHFQ